MSPSIVVVILVAAGEARAPTTATLVAAAADALGPTASLVVRETPTPSDADALRLENQLQAAAVVQIVWTNSARTRVKLRLHRARYDRWVEREVAFRTEDSPRERNRTLGFALGSMLLPEGDSRRRPDRIGDESAIVAPPPSAAKTAAVPWPSTETRPEPETMTRPETTPDEAEPELRPRDARGRRAASQVERDLAERDRALDVERERENEPATKPRATAEAEPPEPPSEPPSEPFAIDLTAIGATGLGGPATGYGGAIQVERFVLDALWWAAKATVRDGAVPGQNGNDLVVSLMTGGTWRPFRPRKTRPFHLGVGLQIGMFLHNFSHRTPSSTIEYQQHLVPGMAALADGGWRITASWDAIVGVGLEMAFGTSWVTVKDRPVATVPRFRGLAAAGVRFRF